MVFQSQIYSLKSRSVLLSKLEGNCRKLDELLKLLRNPNLFEHGFSFFHELSDVESEWKHLMEF